MSEYLIVILATLLAALPLLCGIAYKFGYRAAIRRMAYERRWEHWLIRNESQRNLRF